jgi:hypothetical protein
MPARDDEGFIHFQECLTSLNEAWRILEEVVNPVTSASPILRLAAFRMAIVEYAKPFKKSFGAPTPTQPKGRKHALKFPSLSADDIRLHKTLLELRDQVLAHSDLSQKDAKVYVGTTSGRAIPVIISETAPELPDPETVRLLVERVLDALYAQLSMYERQFQ